MKRVIIAIIVILISISFFTSELRADDVCDGATEIEVNRFQRAKLADIFEHYTNATYIEENYDGLTLYDPANDIYCLAIKHSADMPLRGNELLAFVKLDDKNVHIIGLKINSMMDEAPLTITHDGGEGTIYLRSATLVDDLEAEPKTTTDYDVELTNVGDGILLASEGTPSDGAIQLDGVNITGGDEKGDCITVTSPGTILNNVEITGCEDGVSVAANDVRISDSRIYTNEIGIHIADGVTGTDFSSSLIYANDDEDAETFARFDGVHMEGGISDLRFFEVVDDEPVYCEADKETCEFDNEQHMARILLPEGHGYDGRVELYLAKKEECSSDINFPLPLDQPCKLIEELSSDISYEVLAEGEGVQTELPTNYMNQEIVAIYTSTEKGSTVISQKFKIVSGEAGTLGVVAFVQTPYDIPTPGGGATDDADLGSGTGAGDDVDSIGGSGMDAGGASSSGMKCSLILDGANNPSIGITALVIELCLLILSIALLTTTRQAKARIKR